MYTFNIAQSINDQEWIKIFKDSLVKMEAGAYDYRAELGPYGELINIPQIASSYDYIVEGNWFDNDPNIFCSYLRGYWQNLLNSGSIIIEVRYNNKLVQLILADPEESNLVIQYSLYSPNELGTTSWIYSSEYTKAMKKYLVLQAFDKVIYEWFRTPKVDGTCHNLKPLLDYYTENNSFGSNDNNWREANIYDALDDDNPNTTAIKMEKISHKYVFNLD